MILIRKPSSKEVVFDKEKIIAEIVSTLKEKYPAYMWLINDQLPQWDIIIIRTIECEVVERRGMMGYEANIPKRFQQVFAVRIISDFKPEDANKDFLATNTTFDPLHFPKAAWATESIITDNVGTVFSRLKNSY